MSANNMQTNATLRRRAFRLYRQHGKLLLPIYFLFALINILWYAVKIYLVRDSMLNRNLDFVYQIALSPVMALGVNHLLLHLVRGSDARWSMIFDIVKSPQMLPKAIAVGLIAQAPMLVLLLLFNVIGIAVVQTPIQSTLFLVLSIVFILFGSWIICRVFLFPYLFIMDPEESLKAQVKASFQTMRGKVWHLIWFDITISWWLLPVIIGIMLLFPPMAILRGQDGAGTGWPLLQLVVFPFIGLLSPYFSLALTGFANELLPSERDIRRARRNNPHPGGKR